jgi:hypothetical protein
MKTLEEFIAADSGSCEKKNEFAEAVRQNRLDSFFREHDVCATKEDFIAYTKKLALASGELTEDELAMAGGGVGQPVSTGNWVMCSIAAMESDCTQSALDYVFGDGRGLEIL